MTLRRVFVIAIIMLIPTYLLFGPMGGFHHIYIFGIFDYMAWNGEDPSPVHFVLGDEHFEVILHPALCLLTIAVWLGILWFVIAGTRPVKNAIGEQHQHS